MTPVHRKFSKLLLTLLTALAILVGSKNLLATISGVPGDGILDVYYFPEDGSVYTNQGWIDRPAGTLTVDTDGVDMVAILVGGPNVAQPPQCDLCNHGLLHDPFSIGFPLSTWIVAHFNDSTQWIRENPLSTPGFSGIMGDGADATAYFPVYGLANYGPDLTGDDFEKVFADYNGTDWSVAYASNGSGAMYTNVTVVPEPQLFYSFAFALLALMRGPYKNQ